MKNDTVTVKAIRNVCQQLGIFYTKNSFGWTIKDADHEAVATDRSPAESLESLKVYYGGRPQFEELLASEGLEAR